VDPRGQRGSMNRRRRRLSQQDLTAAGVTPGLMARRYDAAGRARLEMLAPEGPERRAAFIRRLTSPDETTSDSERSE
jgi:hypothetical protein